MPPEQAGKKNHGKQYAQRDMPGDNPFHQQITKTQQKSAKPDQAIPLNEDELKEF